MRKVKDWFFCAKNKQLRNKVYWISFLARPGGRDWESFSALLTSVTFKVYKYFEHRILNFRPPCLSALIFTSTASSRLVSFKKSRISLTSFGIVLDFLTNQDSTKI